MRIKLGPKYNKPIKFLLGTIFKTEQMLRDAKPTKLQIDLKNQTIEIK